MTQLRPLTERHLRTVADWLPSLSGVDGDRLLRAVDDASSRGEALAVVGDGVAGVLAYRRGAPAAAAARVELLAVAPDRRRLGIGSRAALALERRLARDGIARLYALVPADRGLALYFWLRLGYRPLTQADWPAPVEGKRAAWMVRELRPRRAPRRPVSSSA